jgi:hypothetical protein
VRGIGDACAAKNYAWTTGMVREFCSTHTRFSTYHLFQEDLTFFHAAAYEEFRTFLYTRMYKPGYECGQRRLTSVQREGCNLHRADTRMFIFSEKELPQKAASDKGAIGIWHGKRTIGHATWPLKAAGDWGIWG